MLMFRIERRRRVRSRGWNPRTPSDKIPCAQIGSEALMGAKIGLRVLIADDKG
jgi:hypothetical protein